MVIGRMIAACAYAPRKRVTACMLILIAIVFTIAVLGSVNTRLRREDRMEEEIANMKAQIDNLKGMYHARQEEVINLQEQLRNGNIKLQSQHEIATTLSPEAAALLENLTDNSPGSMAASGVNPKTPAMKAPYVYQLLPHLMNDPHSLKPAYHMRGNRNFTDIVIGIPTVKRDKESYLLITVAHLIEGLREQDLNSTAIVVYVGETDLEYVLNIARQLETLFPMHVRNGLIEVISPSASYYPDLNVMPPTLGDSSKRFRWRTKQNLDTLYLMAYARTKGTYYLMLEDDTICKRSYMQEIKDYTAAMSVSNPKWFFIEFCPIGGIGKLFRSSDLLHFITYVQLFYDKLPIDWLLESYLADKVCTIEKASKTCKDSKLEIRPKYKYSLFQHIGLYSSLKGKIQKVKNVNPDFSPEYYEDLTRGDTNETIEDTHFGAVRLFYPHENPHVDNLYTDIEVHSDYTIRRAYEGLTFFWGIKPKKGNVIEFWFDTPIAIERYTFRSGNVEHVSDKFYETVVEVMPAGQNFTQIGDFDEFGMADGTVNKEIGPVNAIRLKVKRDSTYWAILSEIEIKLLDGKSSR